MGIVPVSSMNMNANVTPQERELFRSAAQKINDAISKIKTEDGSSGKYVPNYAHETSPIKADSLAVINLAKNIDKIKLINTSNINTNNLSEINNKIRITRSIFNKNAYITDINNKIENGKLTSFDSKKEINYKTYRSQDELTLFQLETAISLLNQSCIESARGESNRKTEDLIKKSIRYSEAAFVNSQKDYITVGPSSTINDDGSP
jgi:hypothetical protein